MVVAALAALGRHALPGIENQLAVVDLRSAWRLLPDLQVGIVSIPDQARRSRLLGELRKHQAVRQGVSPAYPELSATGEGLRLARITMSTAPRSGGVREFDDDALSIAAVAAPDVTSRLVASVLGPLRTMRPDDREILLRTLEVWLDRGGSADLAAEQLFCHRTPCGSGYAGSRTVPGARSQSHVSSLSCAWRSTSNGTSVTSPYPPPQTRSPPEGRHHPTAPACLTLLLHSAAPSKGQTRVHSRLAACRLARVLQLDS